MSILKAFLYIALLIAIETILTLGFQFTINSWRVNPDYIFHYYSASRLITKLLTYSIILFLIIKLKHNLSDSYKQIKRIDWKIILLILLTALGYEFISKPLLDLKQIINSISNLDTENINNANTSLKHISGYTLVRVLILAPILEELFFRKILFKRLYKENSLFLSILVSSICFGLIHILPNWENVLPSVIFGVICCLIYNKTKNIFYPILFHFTVNLITYMHSFQPESNFNWIYWLTFISGIVFTIYGVSKIERAKIT